VQNDFLGKDTFALCITNATLTIVSEKEVNSDSFFDERLMELAIFFAKT